MPQYVGAVYVDVKFDANKVGADLQQTLSQGAQTAAAGAGKSLSQIGTDATRVGRQVTFGLSAPLLGVSTAASKTFLSFDESMSKIAALTRTEAGDLEDFGKQARQIGVEFGVGADEAAAGLYQILSSGIDASEAIDTLRATARGAATGLGDTGTVASVVTSAMNAYRQTGLTAAQATDVLTSAVTDGKGEAEDLSTALGRVIPIAAQMGVSFAEMTGSIGAMTNSGLSADEAATGLRQVLVSLQKPTKDAEEALQEVGLTGEGLRQQLGEQGLLPTLQTLQEHFEGNDDATSRVFGNVRALTAVYNLYGQNAEDSIRIVENAQNSQGRTEESWNKRRLSASVQQEQAQAKMQDAMIGFGQAMTPIITQATELAATLFGLFDKLPDPMKQQVALFVALGAAIGPVIYSVGSAISLFAGFGTVTKSLAASSTEAAVAQEALGASSTVTAVETEVAAGALGTEALAAEAVQGALFDATAAQEASVAAQGQLFVAADAVTVALAEEAVANEAAAVAAAEAAAAAEAEAAAMAEAATSTSVFAGVSGGLLATMLPLVGIFAAVAIGAAVIGKRYEESHQAAKALTDQFNRKISVGGIAEAEAALGKTRAEIQGLSDDIDNSKAPWDKDYRDELGEYKDGLQGAADGVQKNIDVSRRLADQTGENENAIFTFLEKQRVAGKVFKDDAEALSAYRAEVAKTGGVVSTAATETGKLIEKAQALGDAYQKAIGANNAYRDAVDKVTDAHQAVTDAEQKKADAQANETKATERAAEAHQKYLDSLKKVRDAQQDVTDAQKALQDALRGPSEEEAIGLKSAELSLKEAKARLTAGKFDTPIERERAKLDVRRAQLDLERERAAHDKRVAEARKDVTSAEEKLTDAQKASNDARKGELDASAAVIKAKQDTAKATDDIAKANENLGKAQEATVGAAIADTTAQDQLNQVLETQKGALRDVLAFYDEVAARHPDAMKNFEEERRKLVEIALARAKPTAPTREDIDRKGRSVGGPVSAGQSYDVVERGLPELYTSRGKTYMIPATGGSVVALHPSSGGAGGAPVQADINIYDARQPVETAFEVRRQLRKASYLNGKVAG